MTGQNSQIDEASPVAVFVLLWFRTDHELRKCMQAAAQKLCCMQWELVAQGYWLCDNSFWMPEYLSILLSCHESVS